MLLVGVKSLECNFNPKARTYNPHLHIIVPDKEMAETLKREWLASPELTKTSYKGQKIRRVNDTERDLIEIIKYGTKIFTEPDLSKKKNNSKIYIAAMVNIIDAMKNHRVFDRFGFNLPKPIEEKVKKVSRVYDYDRWIYVSKRMDWFSEITGQAFADYQLEVSLFNLLVNNIDTELQ